MSRAAAKAWHVYRLLCQKAEEMEEDFVYEEIKGHALAVQDFLNQLNIMFPASKSAYLKRLEARMLSIMLDIRQVAERFRQPFILFVMGNGKYGKSSLVNVLLGREEARVDFLPKTWKIDVFTAWQEEGEVLIKFSDGSVKSMSREEAERLIEEEEEKYEASRRLVREKLKEAEQRFWQLKGEKLRRADREEIEKYLKEKMLYRSPVLEARWKVDYGKYTRVFDIVDTPGLYQEGLHENRDMRVTALDYYYRSDGVLWLLDATRISSGKTGELMKELDEALGAKGRKTGNIIGVLNKIDMVKEEERDRVLKEAYRLFGGYFCCIVPFSARKAWEGLQEKDSLKMAESGYNLLEEAVNNHFISRLRELKREKAEDAYLRYLEELRGFIAECREELAGRRKEKEKKEERLKASLAVLGEEINLYIKSSLESFMAEINARIDHMPKQVFEESDAYLQSYVEEYIINSEEIEAWGKELEKGLLEKLNSYLGENGDYYIFSDGRKMERMLFDNLIAEKITVEKSSGSINGLGNIGLGEMGWMAGIVSTILIALLAPIALGILGGLLVGGAYRKVILAVYPDYFRNKLKSNVR